MTEQTLIKNMEFSKTLNIMDMVDYRPGQVVSRTLAQSPAMSMTMFAFAKGEGLSTHTAAGDALVQILDGEAEVTIGEETLTVKAGQVVAMPRDIPHSLQANKDFKMFLVVVKGA